jgi:hypothetical protein
VEFCFAILSNSLFDIPGKGNPVFPAAYAEEATERG